MRRRHSAVSTTSSIGAGNRVGVSSTSMHKEALVYTSEPAVHAMALDKQQAHFRSEDDLTCTQGQAATGYESTTIVPAVSQSDDRQITEEQGQSLITQMLSVYSSEYLDDQQMGLMPLMNHVMSCFHPGMDWFQSLVGQVSLACVRPPMSYTDLFVPSHPKTDDDQITPVSSENDYAAVDAESSVLRQRNR